MNILQPSLNILMKRAQQEIERRQKAVRHAAIVIDLNCANPGEPDDWRVLDLSGPGPGEPPRRLRTA